MECGTWSAEGSTLTKTPASDSRYCAGIVGIYEITVLDVVAALDGVPSPAECTQGRCTQVDSCGASSVWIEAQRALEEVLSATTIGDLLRREDSLRDVAPMYHI